MQIKKADYITIIQLLNAIKLECIESKQLIDENLDLFNDNFDFDMQLSFKAIAETVQKVKNVMYKVYYEKNTWQSKAKK